MTGARRWGAVLAGGAVACLSLFASAPAAASSGTPEAAYWWQPEPVAGLIPVPGVPSNGLFVSSAASGPQAESAVRFAVADPSTRVRLTLHISSQERVGTPAVVGYPATSDWSTGGPQAWSARPSYRSHAKPAKGVFHTSGANPTMTITFPAAEAPTGIVLVPAHAAVGGNAPTFSVAFAPPAAADVAVLGSSSPSSTPSGQRPSASNQPATRGGGGGGGGGGTATPAGPHSSPATVQAGPTKRTVTPSQSGTPSPASSPSSTAPRGDDGPGDPDDAMKGIIIVAGVVAAGLLLLAGWRGVRRA